MHQTAGPAMADGRLFSVAPQARPIAQSATGTPGWALYIAKQNSRPPPSSAALRPPLKRAAVLGRPFAACRRPVGRAGRGRSDQGKNP
jgi:hypothetical protein